MATPSEFYDYLSNIRKGYSDYLATNPINDKGSQTREMEIELTKILILDACVYLMNKYDPTTTIHKFTASEMRDFMKLANDIMDTNHSVDFEQFYS